jgi:hypothetical protein
MGWMVGVRFPERGDIFISPKMSRSTLGFAQLVLEAISQRIKRPKLEDNHTQFHPET